MTKNEYSQKLKMNNNISESYCSFEASKLLKEKGFKNENQNVGFYTLHDGIFYGRAEQDGYSCIQAPTHALAIEWIRQNHNSFIEIRILSDKRYFAKIYIDLDKTHKGNGNFTYFDNEKTLDNKFECYNSPQEATEAALLYTLKNLMK